MKKVLFFLLNIMNILPIIAMEPKQEELFNAIEANDPVKVKELIDSGINIDAKDKEGNTPLMLAVAKTEPNIAIIKAILDEIPNTLTSNKKGMAIKIAQGIIDNAIRTEIIKSIDNAQKQFTLYAEITASKLNIPLLTNAIKNISTITNSPNPDRNLLALAIKRKNKAIVKELIEKGADVNQVLRNGKTPLMIANEVGDADIIAQLRTASAASSVEPTKPTSPKTVADYFFDAVETGRNEQAIYYITSNAVRVDEKNNDGNTALIIAIEKNNIDLINKLLKTGAYIASRNNLGDTPLGLAINRGNSELVKTLLSKSKKFDIDNPLDKDDNTALILAVKGNNKDIIDAILLQGPNPSLINKNGETAVTFANTDEIRNLLKIAQEQENLVKAIYESNPPISASTLSEIKKLITKDVSLKIQNEERNPLVLAIYLSDPGLIELLIKEKPDKTGINQILRNGKTPLIIAIEDIADPKIVKVLLENGADPELAGSDGKTPLEIAAGKEEIIKLLKEAIAKKIAPVIPPTIPVTTPPVDNKLLLSSLQKLTQTLKALHMKLMK